MFLLKDTGQEGLLAARYRLAKFNMEIAEHDFSAGGTTFPAGSWILPAQDGLADAVRTTAADLGLDFTSVAAAPDVPAHDAQARRASDVWVPWADTDSIGWIRYSLDQRKVPYTYLRDEDIRAGTLRDKIDVLLYGHVDLELAEQIQGLPKAWGPMPFKKRRKRQASARRQNPTTSPAASAGRAWLRFSASSKTAGCWSRWAAAPCSPLEGGIVRGVRRSSGGVPRSTQGGGSDSAAAAQQAATRTPGAHVRVTFEHPDSPLAYGYPASTYVFRQNFPLYDAPRQLAAHGLLHHLPRRPGRPQQHRHGMGRQRRRAVRGQRPGLGRESPHRPPRDFRHARWPGPRRRFQLQPSASRSEPRRPPPGLERDSQLAGNPGGKATGINHGRLYAAKCRIRGRTRFAAIPSKTFYALNATHDLCIQGFSVRKISNPRFYCRVDLLSA